MKNTGRIWVISLIIQPIIFAFFMPEAWLMVIPIEIIGSIPGIITFGLLLHAISEMRIALMLKWIILLGGAMILAFLSSCAVCITIAGMLSFKSTVLCLPATGAALLAVLVNVKSVHKQLKHELAIAKDPQSSIFNV